MTRPRKVWPAVQLRTAPQTIFIIALLPLQLARFSFGSRFKLSFPEKCFWHFTRFPGAGPLQWVLALIVDARQKRTLLGSCRSLIRQNRPVVQKKGDVLSSAIFHDRTVFRNFELDIFTFLLQLHLVHRPASRSLFIDVPHVSGRRLFLDGVLNSSGQVAHLKFFQAQRFPHPDHGAGWFDKRAIFGHMNLIACGGLLQQLGTSAPKTRPAIIAQNAKPMPATLHSPRRLPGAKRRDYQNGGRWKFSFFL